MKATRTQISNTEWNVSLNGNTAKVAKGDNNDYYYYEGMQETANGEKELVRGKTLNIWTAFDMASTICQPHPARA